MCVVVVVVVVCSGGLGGFVFYHTFYVNTICLTRNSRFGFVLGCVKHSFIPSLP